MWKLVAALASIVFMATTHARAQTMPEYATHVLVGSWQLVKFVDSNGQSMLSAIFGPSSVTSVDP